MNVSNFCREARSFLQMLTNNIEGIQEQIVVERGALARPPPPRADPRQHTHRREERQARIRDLEQLKAEKEEELRLLRELMRRRCPDDHTPTSRDRRQAR